MKKRIISLLLVFVMVFPINIISVQAATTVYVTNTGSKYHRAGCQYLKKSCIAISLSDAQSYGYGACSKCNPPTSEPVVHSHSWDAGTVTTTATCKSAGVKTYHCTTCKETKTETISKTNNHNWNDGKIVKMPTASSDGTKQYTCTVCGLTQTKTVGYLFDDVLCNQYYTEPVVWAVNEKITSGTDLNHFSPELTCTQAHILTFLWRAAGEPEPSISNPYTSNVDTTGWYYKAMVWAYERGIVTNSWLNPSAACNRSDVVLYLWRYSGSPEPSKTATFNDVNQSSVYAKAVSWAVENEITSGVGSNKFAPNDNCIRGQIVTFLYRSFAA